MHSDVPKTRCVICGRPCPPGVRHFCSSRCADIDLARWLGEDYRFVSDQSQEHLEYRDEEAQPNHEDNTRE